MIFDTTGVGTGARARRTVALAGSLAGPNSPLVVYGDTSQDGVWYGGQPDDVLGYEFGPKPFDPFTKIPDAENEDDEWVFPLANPYAYAGNDVIDAQRPVRRRHVHPGVAATCRSVGFTAYGGAGNDLIIGSQAGDHLAGGSGDDEIRGLRGVDHIYGDSGRQRQHPHPRPDDRHDQPQPGPDDHDRRLHQQRHDDRARRRRSVRRHDGRRPRPDLRRGPGHPRRAARRPPTTTSSSATTARSTQQVADPNLPDRAAAEDPDDARSRRSGGSSRAASRTAPTTSIFGNLGRDVIVGGAGNDMLDGDEQDDLVFGDQIFLSAASSRPARPTSRRHQPGRHRPAAASRRCAARCSTAAPTARPRAAPAVDRRQQRRAPGRRRRADLPRPGQPGRRPYPWWAEYASTTTTRPTVAHFHDFASDNGDRRRRQLGATTTSPAARATTCSSASSATTRSRATAASTRAFARHGRQRRRDRAQHDRRHVARQRLAHARRLHRPGERRSCATTSATSTSSPSFEAATDGEDYIEGNGGNDIVFGGLGQDDIVGGSSDFFSLDDAAASGPTATTCSSAAPARASAATTTRRAPRRRDLPDDAADVHARDADTIVGDNGRIIRIVGVNGTPLGADRPPRHRATSRSTTTRTTARRDLRPERQDRRPRRHAARLHAGRPRLRPGRLRSARQRAGVLQHRRRRHRRHLQRAAADRAPVATAARPARGSATSAATTRSTASPATTPSTAAAATTSLYGDAQDDDLIGGWGNDWISGGTGAGRRPRRRRPDLHQPQQRHGVSWNNATGTWTGATCTAGSRRPRTASRPDRDLLQRAALRRRRARWRPTRTRRRARATSSTSSSTRPARSRRRRSTSPTCLTRRSTSRRTTSARTPTARATCCSTCRSSTPTTPTTSSSAAGTTTSCTAAPATTRSCGSEALGDSPVGTGFVGGGYVPLYPDVTTCQQGVTCSIGVIRTDWTRPWNPGDMLHFGADTNPWHSNHHNAQPPRRVPALRRVRPAPRDPVQRRRRDVGLHRRSHRAATSAPAARRHPVPVPVLPELRRQRREAGLAAGIVGRETPAGLHQPGANGTCLATGTKFSDGNDAIFGDLGNDWMVGGTGQDTIWGGWGNDLLNADDDLRPAASPTPRTATADGRDQLAERHSRHAPELRGPRLRRRRPRHPHRQHRRRPADRLGRRVQQLPRPVRAVRHRDRQPPGRAAAARVPLRAVVQRGRRPDARQRPGRQRRDAPGPQRRADRRARPGHPAGPRLLAAADRRPDRPAGRQHPGRQARRAARRRLQQRLDAGLRGRQRRRGRSPAARSRSPPPRSARTPRPSSTPTTTCRSTTRSPATMSTQKPTGGWKSNSYVIFDYWSPDRLQVRRHRHLDQQDGHRPPDAGGLDRRRAGRRPGLAEVRHLLPGPGRGQRHGGDGLGRRLERPVLHVRPAGHRRRLIRPEQGPRRLRLRQLARCPRQPRGPGRRAAVHARHHRVLRGQRRRPVHPAEERHVDPQRRALHRHAHRVRPSAVSAADLGSERRLDVVRRGRGDRRARPASAGSRSTPTRSTTSSSSPSTSRASGSLVGHVGRRGGWVVDAAVRPGPDRRGRLRPRTSRSRARS